MRLSSNSADYFSFQQYISGLKSSIFLRLLSCVFLYLKIEFQFRLPRWLLIDSWMGFHPFLQQDAGCHNVTISAILGFLKISFIFIILICSLSEYLSQLYMQSWSQVQQKNCQKISGPPSKTLLLSHVHFPKVLLLTPHPFPQIGKYTSYELRHIMANVLSDYNWWQLIWSRRRNSAPAFWIKAHLDTWTWAPGPGPGHSPGSVFQKPQDSVHHFHQNLCKKKILILLLTATLALSPVFEKPQHHHCVSHIRTFPSEYNYQIQIKGRDYLGIFGSFQFPKTFLY